MPEKSYGHWVDLTGVQLSDGDEGTWIQAFPLGTYEHPFYGEMVFDEKKLKGFVASVDKKFVDTDLDIDYDHKRYTGEAAGWVREAQFRDNEGLFLRVAWTPKAREAIKSGEYKYFSPEFADEWTHPKSGATFKDVLRGGALTNRPFLKDILPVNLSELMLDEHLTPPKKTEPGGLMDPKELRKALGLAEDATDEQVNAKLNELRVLQAALSTQPPTPPTPPAPPAPPKDAPQLTEADIPALLAQLNEHAVNSPATDMLKKLMEQQQAVIASQNKALREIEVGNILDELDRGKKYAVPPAVKEQLREILLKSPKELGEQVLAAYKKTLDLGVISLDEQGWQRPGEARSATDTLNIEIRKLMEADKNLDYREAYLQVTTMRPDLGQATRTESYIKEGS